MGIHEMGGNGAESLRHLFGPQQIDQSIRNAILMCWMGLPQERRTADELEKQIRRMVDRALKDFREDRQAFGVDPTP
jgi:hypothetical protein